MTFREFMQENGYDLITTFWEDFSIADKYGIAMETDELIEEIMKEHNLKK